MATIEINPLEIVQGLEERCENYCNYGREWDSPNVACPKCRGKGYTLTDAGRAMLAFLERCKG